MKQTGAFEAQYSEETKRMKPERNVDFESLVDIEATKKLLRGFFILAEEIKNAYYDSRDYRDGEFKLPYRQVRKLYLRGVRNRCNNHIVEFCPETKKVILHHISDGEIDSFILS